MNFMLVWANLSPPLEEVAWRYLPPIESRRTVNSIPKSAVSNIDARARYSLGVSTRTSRVVPYPNEQLSLPSLHENDPLALQPYPMKWPLDKPHNREVLPPLGGYRSEWPASGQRYSSSSTPAEPFRGPVWRGEQDFTFNDIDGSWIPATIPPVPSRTLTGEQSTLSA
jgi:hypothetical protein